MYGRRSRVIAASTIGRDLKPGEHVHHRNEDRTDDSPTNLEIISAADHNRHHKTGTTKSLSSREKTSRSLKRAYVEGRRSPAIRRGTEQRQSKLTPENVREIRGSSESCLVLSRRYGVSKTTILDVINNRAWSHINV
ncbi:HNH endonuclease [Salinisphaera hydrothermalis]|uniref:HNH endonuclease n=1 Tax=Salinisphaera hydrothermalis TaxID=563188 RepID=UPI00056075A4